MYISDQFGIVNQDKNLNRDYKMFYETQEMTVTQAISFVHKFDKLIGTDRELNKSDDFHGYVICMDLEPNEVDICRKIEDKATK